MDKKYWESYYSKHRLAGEPSLFAKFISETYNHKKNTRLIELGCGNGRDSIYFNSEGYDVLAVDQVEEEIKFLEDQFKKVDGIRFESGDFTNLVSEETYDVVYSRFTLHSVTADQQDRVMDWAYNQLRTGGLFCIEVRGRKNELYRQGTKVIGEEHAYIHDNHYRRFLDFDALCEDLKNLGFSIEFSEEDKGFSPFKNTNETFIRVVTKK